MSSTTDPLQAPPAFQHTSPHKRGRKHRMRHWVLFAVLLLTVPAFYLQLAPPERIWPYAGAALYAFVAVVFLLSLIHSRRPGRVQHSGHHIGLDLLIVAGSAASALAVAPWSPEEWLLRSALAAVILLRFIIFLRRLFSPDGIVYLVALAAALLALAGGGFYWLEPTVHSYADGLWLAFTSGATVGYGDITPTTPASRLFAAFMVLLGYALMSLVTAGITAIFIGEDEKRLRHDLHADIKALRKEVEQLRLALRPDRS
ncbi:MAG: potassium channel family protein [Betaproteobacteria bacterium]